MNNGNKEFVSVIVPVFNDAERIGQCIESLLRQDYGMNNYEIIIVDNNFSDLLSKIISKYPVKYFFENKKQNSYTARNRGLEIAKGSVIAFTDSDCVADKLWISEGVAYMKKENLSVLAGQIKFFYKNKKNIFEVYDSIQYLNQQKSVKKHHVAATANLFVKKEIFDKIGFFDDDQLSGGDGVFVFRAYEAKFNLGYSHNSIVFHPSRNFFEMIKKEKRIALSQVPFWKKTNKSNWFIFKSLIRDFFPPIKFKRACAAIKKRIGEGIVDDKSAEKIYIKINTFLLVQLFFIDWFFRIFRNTYRLKYLFRFLFINKTKNEKN